MSAILLLSLAVIAFMVGLVGGFSYSLYWQYTERRARRLSQEFDEVYRRITGRN